MACNPCNNCNDAGCLKEVPLKCILVPTAYTCIGTSANIKGDTLIAAIDTKLCSILTSLTTLSGLVGELSDEVDQIQTAITAIEGNITSIQGDITTIEGDITAIEGDITTINNTLAAMVPETWKTIGGGGTFDNGQSVPGFTNGAQNGSGLQTVQVRKRGTYIDVRGMMDITLTDVIPSLPLFTLPIGYRVPATIDLDILADDLATTAIYPGEVQFNAAGVVSIVVNGLPASTDLSVTFNFSLDTAV